jgi:hypothetical protein
MRLSSEDAIYCIRFIELLQTLKKVSFSTRIEFTFQLVTALIPLVQTLSESEAYNLGVFINEALSLVKNWNSDTLLSSDIKKREALPTQENSSKQKSILQELRSLILKLYSEFTHKISKLLESGNFILLRNTITLFNRLIVYFPATRDHAHHILDVLEKYFPDDSEKKSSLFY